MQTETQTTSNLTNSPTLHLICGKIAAGKSTLAAKLAREPRTVLISEDEWLAALYPGEMHNLADYVRCTTRLRSVMQGHIEQLLRAGCSVVLDFPANTLSSRSWMKTIITNTQAAHCLHYLEVGDDECRHRLKRRNEEGSHQFTINEEEFNQITQYFVPPTVDEGFNVMLIPSS